MNIEEYLNNIEKKELIYIFVSILIVVFIVYYNFVYPDLVDENKKLLKTEKAKKSELSKTISEIRTIKNSRNILKPTRQKLEDLKEDFKYISYNFNGLDVIKLDSYIIYDIFTKLLNKANSLGLIVSFDVNWKPNPIPPFSQNIDVEMKGEGSYISILKYLQYIDHIPHLIMINSAKIGISLDDKKDIKQELEVKKKEESNSVSFVLTKYSSATLPYFKSLAKANKLILNVSVYSHNVDYFSISFRGGYFGVKNILMLLKNISKKENKPFEFTQLRANLKMTTQKSSSKKESQKFLVKLKIVGVK